MNIISMKLRRAAKSEPGSVNCIPTIFTEAADEIDRLTDILTKAVYKLSHPAPIVYTEAGAEAIKLAQKQAHSEYKKVFWIFYVRK